MCLLAHRPTASLPIVILSPFSWESARRHLGPHTGYPPTILYFVELCCESVQPCPYFIRAPCFHPRHWASTILALQAKCIISMHDCKAPMVLRQAIIDGSNVSSLCFIIFNSLSLKNCWIHFQTSFWRVCLFEEWSIILLISCHAFFLHGFLIESLLKISRNSAALQEIIHRGHICPNESPEDWVLLVKKNDRFM